MSSVESAPPAWLATRRYFSDIGVWPRQPLQIDPERWLRNFEAGSDRQIAEELLKSFLYINDGQTLKMVATSVGAIASTFADPYGAGRVADLAHQWRAFMQDVLVSYPDDKSESPTSSGHLFARYARQSFGVAEHNILTPSQLVLRLMSETVPKPIILIDDILGSGDQAKATMQREVEHGVFGMSTLAREAERLGSGLYYCCAIATSVGLGELKCAYPWVSVHAAHVLPRRYSIGSNDSILLPSVPREDLEAFLNKYTIRAGHDASNRLGYKNFGLLLAFEHSVPDLTIPIIYSNKNGWHPLCRRT